MRKEEKILSVEEMVYGSQVMKGLMAKIERVAKSRSPILILGEGGVGKDLIAARIYEKSDASDKAHFAALDCSAYSEALLESELFGHKKGSFSGAYTDKKGILETIDGGILFLKEIGSMSHRIQAKLLRFLQEGEVFRIGDSNPAYVNVRLLCSSQRSLDKDIENGDFRNDLYYRLNTITLTVPPLRSRTEDIPLLVKHFLKQTSYEATGD